MDKSRLETKTSRVSSSNSLMQVVKLFDFNMFKTRISEDSIRSRRPLQPLWSPVSNDKTNQDSLKGFSRPGMGFYTNFAVPTNRHGNVNGKGNFFLSNGKNNEVLKANRKLFCQMDDARHHFNEYCSSTSLHGLKYVGNENLSTFERLFWSLAFILAVIFAVFFITNVYEKWRQTPVIITLSPTYTELRSIPFPAITICNMNQARKAEALKVLQTGTETEKQLLQDFCNSNNSFVGSAEAEEEQGDWPTVRKFMIKVGHTCASTTVYCRWRGEDQVCNDLFNNALTDEGICCTFNRVHRKFLFRDPTNVGDLNITFPVKDYLDWTPEKGFDEGYSRSASPMRAVGAGNHLGLTIILDTQLDEYYCSTTASAGFKVVLHSPVETPRISEFGFFISPGKESRVVILPRLSDATEQIRAIHINKRQCFFSNERTLQYYRTYTQRNCNLECLTNNTLEICGCVPFYLPKNNTTPVCVQSKENCTQSVKTNMETSTESRVSCNCLPGCFEITYGKDQSEAILDDSFQIRDDYLRGFSPAYFKRNMAVVNFYFLNNEFTSNSKGVLFGLTEFLSNTGGLLGLFMGFSFLSAIELFYYCPVRLFWKRKLANKSNDTDSLNNGILYPFTK